ncbi:MAG: hypothetical protein NTW38_01630 [Candidatus Aminicenantes bacterium]|nr:hypothetical protein [Candidatus Aminicenantes bacterium]
MKYKYLIFTIFLFIILITPILVRAYGGADLGCLGSDGCCKSGCLPKTVNCPDTRAGCIVQCKDTSQECPPLDNYECAYCHGPGFRVQKCFYAAIPPICSITASPSSISLGDSSVLTWSANIDSIGSSCTASGGWSGTKTKTGNETVYPTSTTTYNLTCKNVCDSTESATCSATVTVSTVPAFNFNITTNPTSGSVTRGNSVTTAVTVTKTAGTGATVNLTATSLPTGVTASFNPSSCNPGTSSCTSTLTLSANSTAPAITSDAITVTGTSGATFHSTTYNLTVVVPVAFNFNLTANPSSGSVVKGHSTTSTITATKTSGTAEAVSFSISSTLPTGVTKSFSPTSCTPNSTCTSILTLTTTNSASPGTYNITVKGTSASASDTVVYALNITVPVSCTITANPDSGKEALSDVDLTVNVTGGTGNIVYKMDCTGLMPYDFTSPSTSATSYTKSDLCNYYEVGTHMVQAEVTRGSSDPVTCTNTVTLYAPTLSCTLSATPYSGSHPLSGVILKADVSGTATGTINYTFYCNRNDTSTAINPVPPNPPWNYKKDGITTEPYSAPATTCNSVYANSGNYTAKVIVERSNAVPTQCQKTVTVTNDPPVASGLSVTSSSQCITAPYYSFSWTYSDSDDDNESQFLFQIDNNSNFSSPVIDRSISVDYPSPSSNNQTVTLATIITDGYLSFNTKYYWRARVIDEYGATSNWVNGSSFITPAHHYPMPDFTNVPARPNVDETVQFTDASKCFDDNPVGSGCSTATGDSYNWIFTGGTPGSSTLENPTSRFMTPGKHNVTLQVSDSDGFACSKTKSLNANYPMPTWKEILPF